MRDVRFNLVRMMAGLALAGVGASACFGQPWGMGLYWQIVPPPVKEKIEPVPVPGAPSAPGSPVVPGASAPAGASPGVPGTSGGTASGATTGTASEPLGHAMAVSDDVLPNEITPELESAVEHGLAALARFQRADGSFGEGQFGGNVAITALSGIAFMADGHIPGRGAYGDNVSKALEYILANCAENGLVAGDTASGPMYGHGFATLFLGEVYGMLPGGAESSLTSKTHQALVRAVRLIETTQNEEGGWRYNPLPYDADTSVTICQIMALRSARNAGLDVSKQVIEKAVKYVQACQNPDGGFRYQMQGGPSLWPRSAAGVATLYYAGKYDDPGILRGLRYLEENALPGKNGPNTLHYFYGQYYSVQTMFLAGKEHWARWWPAIRSELLATQNSDTGVWNDSSVGDAYGTAMALIILQMPKRYLPIYQK